MLRDSRLQLSASGKETNSKLQLPPLPQSSNQNLGGAEWCKMAINYGARIYEKEKHKQTNTMENQVITGIVITGFSVLEVAGNRDAAEA